MKKLLVNLVAYIALGMQLCAGTNDFSNVKDNFAKLEVRVEEGINEVFLRNQVYLDEFPQRMKISLIDKMMFDYDFWENMSDFERIDGSFNSDFFEIMRRSLLDRPAKFRRRLEGPKDIPEPQEITKGLEIEGFGEIKYGKISADREYFPNWTIEGEFDSNLANLRFKPELDFYFRPYMGVELPFLFAETEYDLFKLEPKAEAGIRKILRLGSVQLGGDFFTGLEGYGIKLYGAMKKRFAGQNLCFKTEYSNLEDMENEEVKVVGGYGKEF